MFVAIRFHCVTALPAGCARAAPDRPPNATMSETAMLAIQSRLEFICPCGLTEALRILIRSPYPFVHQNVQSRSGLRFDVRC